MRPAGLASPGGPHIKVLSKRTDEGQKQTDSEGRREPQPGTSTAAGGGPEPKAAAAAAAAQPTGLKLIASPFDIGLLRATRSEKLAARFKLVDERNWNIAASEPASEKEFFTQGTSAMSIVSVLGPMGSGKSSLLNKLAGRHVFPTHTQTTASGAKWHASHKTRGIDVFSTYQRILLDCQPMLAPSLLEDFLKGRSASQFPPDSLIAEPATSCHMISLQLATFLIATSDYVIIVPGQTLVDVHLLKLLATAIMLIGEDNLRAKFVIFSKSEHVHGPKFKALIERCLGQNVVKKFVSDEEDLHGCVAPYALKKCDIYSEDPTKFTGKSWLSSCQRLWESTIKGSSMFADYAAQVYNSSNS